MVWFPERCPQTVYALGCLTSTRDLLCPLPFRRLPLRGLSVRIPRMTNTSHGCSHFPGGAWRVTAEPRLSRPRSRIFPALILALVCLALVGIAFRPAEAYQTKHVVLVIIDGLRYSEGL